MRSNYLDLRVFFLSTTMGGSLKFLIMVVLVADMEELMVALNLFHTYKE